jgi:hypothetical protein
MAFGCVDLKGEMMLTSDARTVTISVAAAGSGMAYCPGGQGAQPQLSAEGDDAPPPATIGPCRPNRLANGVYQVNVIQNPDDAAYRHLGTHHECMVEAPHAPLGTMTIDGGQGTASFPQPTDKPGRHTDPRNGIGICLLGEDDLSGNLVPAIII